MDYKITYPLIGIIAEEPGREMNYIFTEEEVERTNFSKARSILLENEEKLVRFIHGSFNNMEQAKNNPDWYWKNNAAYIPAKSKTFNDVVPAIALCRANLFYTKNHRELPVRHVVVRDGSIPADTKDFELLQNISYLTSDEILDRYNCEPGDHFEYNANVSNGAKIAIYVTVYGGDELPDINAFLVKGKTQIPLDIESISISSDSLVFYEYSAEADAYTREYHITIEKEKELERE